MSEDGSCVPTPLLPTVSSVMPSVRFLLLVASSLFVGTLTIGHAFSRVPLRKLGKRPDFLLLRLSGIWGYDSSLGSLSPLLKLLLHVSDAVALWAATLAGLAWIGPRLAEFALTGQNVCSAGEVNMDDAEAGASYLFKSSGTIAFALYLAVDLLYEVTARGVSDPGGPRARKIRRMPRWDDRTTHCLRRLEDDDDGGKGTKGAGGGTSTTWRCAVSEDSHGVTHERFGLEKESAKKWRGLSGEPAGRQIWTWTEEAEDEGGEEEEPAGDDDDDDDEAKDDAEEEDDAVIVGARDVLGAEKKEEEERMDEGKKEKEGKKAAGGGKGGGGGSGAGGIWQSWFKSQVGVDPDVAAEIEKIDKEEASSGETVEKQPKEEEEEPKKDEERAKEAKGDAKGDAKKDDDDDKTEKLIEEMASGGRKTGFNPSVNPNSCDMIFRAQQIRSYVRSGSEPPSVDERFKPKTPSEAARKGAHFYSMLQTDDGHWAGDYGGPHFLMPGMITAWYVMGRPTKMLSPEQTSQMSHYLRVHQQSDGGWGTHIESPSTMFGTVMCYVALRLLGADPDDDVCVKGRKFIRDEGGAVMTSSWAKLWLCLLGCMEWDGHNSIPPELWLLPNWFPFHPGRLWCHCRMVYLPMGYLYGSEFVYSKADSDPTIAALREELYCQPYDSIKWSSTRHLVAPMDNYSPIPFVMKFLQDLLALYETWSIFRPLKNFVRSKGLKFCVEYMKAEDLQTNYIDIGPVNKALNMVSAFHAANSDVNDPAVMQHMMRIPDYLWLAEDGLKMQGYNGSQCWDTSFAIQAMCEAKVLDVFPNVSTKVWSYLEATQILSTETSQSSPAYLYESHRNRDKFYRHASKGGWPFSTSAHGWPISDCTGEGLKGVLALRTHCDAVAEGIKSGSLKTIEESRLHDAINVILTLQNEDGGWATYENNRGFGWYEQLNPSEVFGDIMIDYSYVECSMASLSALAEFHELHPSHRTREIRRSIQLGRRFMKSIQRADGSWYGSWACCFCYGCWFGIEGLVKAGEPTTSRSIKRCIAFLLSHQRPNGGWGEDFTSCYDKDYAKKGMDSYGDEGSGVVNTAWALLALSAARCEDLGAVRRGVRYLMKRQLPCGDWPQEGIAGVFNRACGITYTSYRNVFPIWALGRCAATYGDEIGR